MLLALAVLVDLAALGLLHLWSGGLSVGTLDPLLLSLLHLLLHLLHNLASMRLPRQILYCYVYLITCFHRIPLRLFL